MSGSRSCLPSSSFCSASVSLWYAHSGVVVFHYPIRGQKETRLCPYCYGSILGPSYSCHLNLSPCDPMPPPPLLPPVTSPVLLISWFPSTLNAPTPPRLVMCTCDIPFPCRPSGSARCRGCLPRWRHWTFTDLPYPTGSSHPDSTVDRKSVV